MSDDSTSNNGPTGERAHAGQSVANPRRLRIGRDGRPLLVSSHPVSVRDESIRSA